MKENHMGENLDRYKKRSAWWFLLPIFFTIFGGLIALTVREPYYCYAFEKCD